MPATGHASLHRQKQPTVEVVGLFGVVGSADHLIEGRSQPGDVGLGGALVEIDGKRFDTVGIHIEGQGPIAAEDDLVEGLVGTKRRRHRLRWHRGIEDQVVAGRRRPAPAARRRLPRR